MNSNLLEFGGTIDLIATAICDFDTPSKHYKKGDIVLDLSDVRCQCNYGDKMSKISSDRTKLSYNEFYLNSMTLSYIPLNNQISNLFMVENNITNEILVKEKCPCFNNILFINDTPVQNSILIPGVNNFTIENMETGARLESEEFEMKDYIVYYKTKKYVSKFILDNKESNIPYLKLQIHFTGNEDKIDSDGYLIIEKAKLRCSPITNFFEDSIVHCSIYADIIDDIIKPSLVFVNR